MHHLTAHAKGRLRQRGIRREVLELLIAHADIETPAGDGCRFLRLSSRAARDLLEDENQQVQVVDQARRVLVLVSPSGTIVTAMRRDPDRRLRPRR